MLEIVYTQVNSKRRLLNRITTVQVCDATKLHGYSVADLPYTGNE